MELAEDGFCVFRRRRRRHSLPVWLPFPYQTKQLSGDCQVRAGGDLYLGCCRHQRDSHRAAVEGAKQGRQMVTFRKTVKFIAIDLANYIIS